MKPSEVLRKAAEICFRNERGGCFSIRVASHGDPLSYCISMEYFRLFIPYQNIDEDYFWWPLFSEARILALCFAADIAESEGN